MPAIIMVVLSIINIFYPILFTVNSLNEYARLPLLWISIPLTVIIYVYVILMVVREKDSGNKKTIIGVLVFLVLPIIAAVFQMLFLGKTYIWPVTSVAILITYLIFETTANARDYLTGLFTRERAEEKINRYLLKQKSFSVIMIDIDNFKQINDTLGHHSGDKVLIEIAKSLLSIFKQDSIVSRFGGDEFIIVSRISDQSVLKERKIETNNLLKLSNLEELKNIKLSFGMAICEIPDEYSIEKIMVTADNDMYKNKEARKEDKR
jgi:diguanylate cyclase (GGDEF)-like protein